VRDFTKEKRRYETAAGATLRKDKRVNIRMTERDLVRFQKKAAEEGFLRACAMHQWRVSD